MHPKFEIPTDPHGKHRYESAMKHVEAAKKAGESIPQDEAHAKYRTAMVHMKKALESGKSADEAHEVFRKIMNGETSGHCHHSK